MSKTNERWKFQLCELSTAHLEQKAVASVLEKDGLMGNIAQFERKFSSFINHKNSGLFVSSATAGLHLLLMAAGISRGDEVIIPGLTFVSDANTVMQ